MLGVATFAGCNVTLGMDGTFTLQATSGVLTPGQSGSFTVTGTATHFAVSAPAGETAGQPITGITITAEDASDSVVTAYTGARMIAGGWGNDSAGGNAPIYPATSVSFSNGVSTTVLWPLYFAAVSTTLTASATAQALTGSATVLVRAGTASGLAYTGSAPVSACSSPNTVFACAASGNKVTFTSFVSVTDQWGNRVSNLGAGVNVTLTQGGGSAGTLTTTTLTILRRVRLRAATLVGLC